MVVKCEADSWHSFQTNGKRFQCKYCGAFKGETIAERDERQAKEARNG